MAEITVSKTKIRDFIKSIESGKYQLPCFQRDFKWNPSKIKSLLNSIQHEYPAGSLLFLKVDSDNPLIPYQGFKYTNSDEFDEKTEMLVLDGQQRMTSCYSVFTNSGYYTYYINYLELMKMVDSGATSFEFDELIVNKKHNQTPSTEIPKGLFPMVYLRDRNTMRSQIQLYVQDIQSDPSKAAICNFLSVKFQDIVDTFLDYEFPYVVLPENSSMESVCKVFQTINTTGLKLSVFDICVAVFVPKGINLKEKVKDSSESKNYVKLLLEKDPTTALQTIALLANREPNSNTLPKVLEETDILNYWDEAIDGIEDTLILFDSFGAGTKKNLSILPYTPMIPVVAAVLARNKYATMDVVRKGNTENKIKAYFYTAALSTRYTEGTNSKINSDFTAMNKWISNDEKPDIIVKGVDWNTEKIINNNKSGAFGKAVLCMLNSLNPRDFYSQSVAVGIGENIASCDLHHIFPKATYGSNEKDLINSVFNFTWIVKETNVYIKDTTTKAYLNDIMSNLRVNELQLKALLNGHCIDNDSYDAMKDEHYTEFISHRANVFKSLFSTAGVEIIEVNAEEVEVEDSADEDEE